MKYECNCSSNDIGLTLYLGILNLMLLFAYIVNFFIYPIETIKMIKEKE